MVKSFRGDSLKKMNAIGNKAFCLRERVGIPYYDPQLILEYTHGFSITDDYRIKLSGEDITWNELLKQKKFAGH